MQSATWSSVWPSGRTEEPNYRFLSPTIPLRLRLCSYYREEQLLVRLTTLARASPSPEVDERQSIGMLASPLFTRRREACAAPSRTYHSNRENAVSSTTHTHCTRESRAEIQKVHRRLIPIEKEYSPSTEKFGIFLNYEQNSRPRTTGSPV